MNDVTLAALMSPLLLVGMLLALEVGRRHGRRKLAQDPEHAFEGTGAIEGAIFGVLGLLLAFTFSGAAGRFDARRELIVSEANAIGTAWLRLDLLPPDAQPPLRELFRQYVDARLAAHRGPPDDPGSLAARASVAVLQGNIWAQAVTAVKSPGVPAGALSAVVSALNEMFDVATSRSMATRMHPPRIVHGMLLVLALVGSLLAGYGMAAGRARKWLHATGFAVILTGVVYVTIDIEFPRQGLVQVDDFDQAIRDVRRSMD